MTSKELDEINYLSSRLQKYEYLKNVADEGKIHQIRIAVTTPKGTSEEIILTQGCGFEITERVWAAIENVFYDLKKEYEQI